MNQVAKLTEWVGRTPMTDPRSLAGSVTFHLLAVLGLSVAAYGASRPRAVEPPQVIRAELDPVDNKAEGRGGQGGGSPGAVGDDRLATVAPLNGDDQTGAASRTATADALLAEILPAPVASEAVQQALPGPQTSGIGALPGAGTGAGGGGGSGGGAGGGGGRSLGPGTEFFGAREHAGSFAYVIDCSGSMATCGSLDVAKRELTTSLAQLPPDARFGVIFYSIKSRLFTDAQGHGGLMSASAANKARVGTFLATIYPDGGTEHMTALRTALALRPEVIFFLTDADTMTGGDVATVLAEAGPTRIQAVEFGRGLELGSANHPLRHLATATGGTYRYIDVTRFAQPGRP